MFIQVYNQPAARESGGGYFPMAASNLCKSTLCRGSSASFLFLPYQVVGLYIEQICLACLFFLKVSVPESRYLALTQGILMLVLVAITVWAHVLLNRSFAREYTLPEC